MKDRVEVDRYTCDGCGATIDQEVDDELPIGYHFSVRAVGGHRVSGTEVGFACREQCIRKAVVAVVNRE